MVEPDVHALEDLFDLSGRVALVTGGTDGIGRGIVEQLVRRGARVALTSRTEERAQAAADGLAAGTADVLGLAADLRDEAAVAAALVRIEERWGGLDTVVANAALLSTPRAPGDVVRADLDRAVTENLFSATRLAHLAAPMLRRRGGGSILFITSIAGHVAAPRMAAYAAGKAALTHLALALAAAFAPDRIRVNCVAPGLIRSRASKPIWTDGVRLERATRGIPLGRIGEASEIGAAVAYLAGPAGAYVTGTTLMVDGGRRALGYQLDDGSEVISPEGDMR